ncbi:cystathionine gamma-synthase [Sesbania bispinosa]|nr:cystathionine gamma-synthase [Sesbania bispinosa]
MEYGEQTYQRDENHKKKNIQMRGFSPILCFQIVPEYTPSPTFSSASAKESKVYTFETAFTHYD